MSNLVQNYKKTLEELTKACSHIENFSQVRQPKLSNLELVALNLTVEYMPYSTELQLFKVTKALNLMAKSNARTTTNVAENLNFTLNN